MDDDDKDLRTIFCGNLSEKVPEEVLYELFLQAGPIDRVSIPKDKEGRQRNFAFITYKHEISVNYAIKLLDGIPLCKRSVSLKRRNGPSAPQLQGRQPSHYRSQSEPNVVAGSGFKLPNPYGKVNLGQLPNGLNLPGISTAGLVGPFGYLQQIGAYAPQVASMLPRHGQYNKRSHDGRSDDSRQGNHKRSRHGRR